MELHLKSARVPAAASDGARLLVDRLWPRGMSKAKLSLTDWPKAVAPSNELRKCVRHCRSFPWGAHPAPTSQLVWA